MMRLWNSVTAGSQKLLSALPNMHWWLISVSVFFESMGKKDEHLYYLVLSAISDVRSAIKEQSSLMVLAQELHSKGDLKRAYDYINFSWEISQFYKTRLRSWMNITRYP